MKKFKFNWLVYAIIALASLVLAILIMPPVAVIDSEKFICGVLAAGLIIYLVFYLLANAFKYKEKALEVQVVVAIELLAIAYFALGSFLLIFDTNIIGINNIVRNIGRIIGATLWLRAVVLIISEANRRSRQKFGEFFIYLAIILITFGTYCFFNVNITFETVCWFIFVIFVIVAIFTAYLAVHFYPKLTAEQKALKKERQAKKAAARAEKAKLAAAKEKEKETKKD